MARTKATLVIQLLRDRGDYDGSSSLDPHIASANQIVNIVAAQAGSGNSVIPASFTPGSQQLELIERWLAAHFYCASDKPLASKSTQGASGSYQGQTGQGFESTFYGQNALRMDTSGTLEAIDKRKFAGGFWLGKPPSQQIPYIQRN